MKTIRETRNVSPHTPPITTHAKIVCAKRFRSACRRSRGQSPSHSRQATSKALWFGLQPTARLRRAVGWASSVGCPTNTCRFAPGGSAPRANVRPACGGPGVRSGGACLRDAEHTSKKLHYGFVESLTCDAPIQNTL